EPALKLRIGLLDNLGRYEEALSDARSLFNVAIMGDTAEALTILDQQLQLAHKGDNALDDKFRQEQIEGAKPLDIGVSPVTSSVLASIPIKSEVYDVAFAKEN